jgi:hypothetical protein
MLAVALAGVGTWIILDPFYRVVALVFLFGTGCAVAAVVGSAGVAVIMVGLITLGERVAARARRASWWSDE